jgi:hypothetical protein
VNRLEGEQPAPADGPPLAALAPAKVENSFSTSACPHRGQESPSLPWPIRRSTSKRLPQLEQRYS